MFNEKKMAAQREFWIAAEKVVSPARKLLLQQVGGNTGRGFGFAEKVRALCAPAYDKSGCRGGRASTSVRFTSR